MTDATSPLDYREKQELGFLERLLLDRRLNFANGLLFFCAVISVALALLHLFVAVFGTPEGRSFRSIHLTVMLTLAVLVLSAVPWVDARTGHSAG